MVIIHIQHDTHIYQPYMHTSNKIKKKMKAYS